MTEIITGKRKNVTIKTVAQDAGVSVSAVSKVLRNAYGVSESLRDNVLESIERLDYRPSSAARGMRGRTYTVGVLLVGLDNPFLDKLVNGINACLGEAGYKTIMGVGQAQTHIETSLIETMLDFKLDALILIGPSLTGETLAKFARHIPIVTIAHHEADATEFDTVNSADRHGAELAVQALIDHGYYDIAMISVAQRKQNSYDVWSEREIGYQKTMNAAGLDEHIRILRVQETPNDRDSAFSDILTSENRARAFFCWSDLHAISLMSKAKEMGLKIPQDIAIVGYDNSPISQVPMVNLASVRQSAQELGETAARCILSRLAGRTKAEHHVITPSLVLRGSL